MQEKIRVIFLIVVASLALVFFGVGIYFAARYTFWVEGAPRPDDMPEILSYFVSAASATLAANLGALLGVSFSRADWRGPEGATEILQWIAASWYLLMLVAAIVLWGMAGFTEDSSKVVALLPEMTRSAVGILIAILAAALGVRTVSTRLVKQ